MNCPLCHHGGVVPYHQDARRSYFQCQQCNMVFVAPEYLPSAQEERAEYDLHENDPDDEGYRRFLSRLTHPLLERLPRPCSGLDFGCGPGPTLHLMLEEQGVAMQLYDPFYAYTPEVLTHQYDVITLTEVIEHLHDPAVTLERLWSQLNSGGILAIMTKRVKDVSAFAGWHYKNDPTHVCFYSEDTFEWLADQFRAVLEVIDKDVVFLTKKPHKTR